MNSCEFLFSTAPLAQALSSEGGKYRKRVDTTLTDPGGLPLIRVKAQLRLRRITEEVATQTLRE